MNKKIAVVVRDRQDEALRMSIGLTLMDDTVDIYVLNRKLAKSERTALNIDTIKELEMAMYSNVRENQEAEFVSVSEIARKLLAYDHVLPY